MKAIFLLGCFAAASAAAFFGDVSSQYVKNVNGVCVVQPGYAVYCITGAPTSLVSANTAACNIVAPSLTAACQAISDSATGTGTNYIISCSNATASGLTSPAVQLIGDPSGPDADHPAWYPTALAPAVSGIQGFADLSLTTANNVLFCAPIVPPACNYTCTTTGTGTGCKAASGTSAVGALPQSLCNAGYFATVTSPTTATTSCPAGGLNGTTWVVVCSNSNTGYVTTAQWFLIASAQTGFTEPKSCNCNKNPVCTQKNANSPTCSLCNLACTSPGLGAGGARQNINAAAAFCPPTATTVAQIWDCFEQAACNGATAKGDICVFGPAGAATAPCPTCPGGSKKGLLGLLGLLGLIPLLLCSSLLCLLLFCIRRNKKERDVHFATFDAGAPQVVAPVCHDFPVAHQTQTVHHATYVGPQHCAVPSGFGY